MYLRLFVWLVKIEYLLKACYYRESHFSTPKIVHRQLNHRQHIVREFLGRKVRVGGHGVDDVLAGREEVGGRGW